jgi:hypothetical protein
MSDLGAATGHAAANGYNAVQLTERRQLRENQE